MSFRFLFIAEISNGVLFKFFFFRVIFNLFVLSSTCNTIGATTRDGLWCLFLLDAVADAPRRLPEVPTRKHSAITFFYLDRNPEAKNDVMLFG